MEETQQSIKLEECQKQANTIQKLSSLSISGVGNPSTTLEQAIFTACLVPRSFESYRLKWMIFIWYFKIEHGWQEVNYKILNNS
jgi:lipopolysaccharide assembly outer membrane protein LptD (OstA)